MPGLAPYIRTLAIGQRTTIEATGTTVFLREATGEILVTLRSTATGERDGVAYTLRMTQAEKWFHAEQFDSVTIENTAGVANTIEFYIGFGDFEKPVPDIVNVQVTQGPNGVHETLVDDDTFGQGNANAVAILADDNTRIQAYITALAGNTDTLRVGDSDVDTDQGTPLAPGETVIFPSKKAIYVCSEGATATDAVAITVFKDQP